MAVGLSEDQRVPQPPNTSSPLTGCGQGQSPTAAVRGIAPCEGASMPRRRWPAWATRPVFVYGSDESDIVARMGVIDVLNRLFGRVGLTNQAYDGHAARARDWCTVYGVLRRHSPILHVETVQQEIEAVLPQGLRDRHLVILLPFQFVVVTQQGQRDGAYLGGLMLLKKAPLGDYVEESLVLHEAGHMLCLTDCDRLDCVMHPFASAPEFCESAGTG